ncbi:NAD-dependent epimerase/dehydratase family protein [Pelobacter seleniigenes]|uniref:NAD-dependent epimerase/dehydratase family protein n=1 Tax=Pelobacter seleniigenes TaxID=407188 RepID=UPI0004A77589|nr:NAD-dependent epimerase/dehydratase family protein [Pelobacter seleniigenes]
MKILVTAGGGFVGSSLLKSLRGVSTLDVKGLVRRKSAFSPRLMNITQIDDLINGLSLSFLSGFDLVIHNAACVHQMKSVADLAKYREENTVTTLNLARQAAAAGVKRFIFLSTIKVIGEESPTGRPYSEETVVNPQDAYAISKYEAEQGLWDIARSTELDVVIIRLPLVYGPGVKANFLRMLQWADKGVLLPFGAIHNKRSLIGLENLNDFILTCLTHPAAANQLFLVSDNHDLSTSELVGFLAGYLGRSSRQISLPPSILSLLSLLLGKRDEFSRLCGSLQVDISKAKTLLGWEPPLTVAAGLQKTAEWYIENKRKGFRL